MGVNASVMIFFVFLMKVSFENGHCHRLDLFGSIYVPIKQLVQFIHTQIVSMALAEICTIPASVLNRT